MIHFKNVRDVLNTLRDVYTYLAIQNKNDELGKRISDRIALILEDNKED
jgi:hypothetical protein